MERLDGAIYKIVAVIFLISCAVSASFLYLDIRGEALVLEIINGDKVERTIALDDLDGDAAIFTVSDDAGFNVFVIDDGAVRMVSSDCGGGDCLRMSPARRAGDIIVCLPHRLLLRMTGAGERKDLDVVSY